MEGEFDRECNEYGCFPVDEQWGRVKHMLLVQAEEKHHKRELKMLGEKWSQICIENGLENPERMLIKLAPKVRDMEKRVHVRLKRHVEEGKKKCIYIYKVVRKE
ncbi:MAG: hypothetical protein ACRC7H_09910 [Plesiomonas shigelloides]